MQKRSEVNKEGKILFRTKLKRMLLVMLCLFFAYSAIYAADVSNKAMSNLKNDDRYALRASMEKNDMLRIDVAGTKHYFDVKNIVIFVNKANNKAKSYASQLMTTLDGYIRSLSK
jgi:hypothetical protein